MSITKRSKVKEVTHLGMEGKGETVTEAREDAKRKIEEALEGSYQPVILCWRGMTGFMWREPVGNCWNYSILYQPQGEGIQHTFTAIMSGREECLASLRNHLAQNGWLVADGKELPEILNDSPLAQQQDFLYWARWQLAAHHAKTVLGITDSGLLHRWACDHDKEF